MLMIDLPIKKVSLRRKGVGPNKACADALPPKGYDIDIYADCQELDLCLIVFLRRAGVMPEEIRRMRVAQVKTCRRQDTIKRGFIYGTDNRWIIVSEILDA